MTIRHAAHALFGDLQTAYRAGDAARCAAAFTEDAVLCSPYAATATGRAAIEALHRDWVGEGGNAKMLTVLDTGSSGDLGWCHVAYSEGDAPGDATGDGTSLSVLVRQPDGCWLIRFCALTADTPPLA